jgi:hypothetical protein
MFSGQADVVGQSPPHDIAASLYDSGIIDKGTAHRLEQRIKAWAERRKAEGRRQEIVEAARKAKFVVTGIKSASQRAAALKVLRAVERLLPQGDNGRQEGLLAKVSRALSFR